MTRRTQLLVDDPSLPPRHLVTEVDFCGLLKALDASCWYRENAPALSNSEVPWGDEVHPFVVEIDLYVPDRDDDQRWIPITVTHPASTGPGTPEFSNALRAAVHRAMLHEADESLLVQGKRIFDPHA